MQRAVRRAGGSLPCIALLLAALLLPLHVRAANPSTSVAPDSFAYYDRTIGEIRVEGVPWAHDLQQQIRGALRVGQPLTLDGVQRAIHLLEEEPANLKRRLSRVTVQVDPLPKDKVRVGLEVEPLRVIAQVIIEGDTSLDHGLLLRAANVPLGSDFWPDDVGDAATRIAQAYLVEGWRHARVDWAAQPTPDGEGVAVAFDVTEGPPTTLVQLQFSGDLGSLTAGERMAAFNLNPDDRLSLEVLDEGLAELLARYRQRHYYLAKVGKPTFYFDGERVTVEVPVAAGPRFRLQVRGNRSFPEALLLSKLRYTGEDPLDVNMQHLLADHLQEFYKSAGFPDATVYVRAQAPSREERLITFLVTERRPLRVVERRFEGLHFAQPEFAPARLLERIDATLEDRTPRELTHELDEAQLQSIDESKDTEKPRPALHVVPSEVFNEAAYADACAEIANLYKSEGFLDPRVGPARLDELAPGRGRVVIPIEEGPRVFVKSIAIVKMKDVDPSRARDDDSDFLPADTVQGVLTVKPGDPVSYAAIEESRNRIMELYKSRGHLFAEVDDKEDDAAPLNGKGQMDVSFVVRPGKVVTVSSTEIKGATHTDPTLIRDALTLEIDGERQPLAEGAVITPQKLQLAVQNLMQLGIFTAAAVDVADPDREEYPKRLVVQLREKPTIALEVKGGFSLVDGPRIAANVMAANLSGRNRSLGLTAKLNYPFLRYNGWFVAQNCGNACTPKSDPLERYISLTFGAPIYLGNGTAPIDQHYDLVNENTIRPAYQLERYAMVATFGGLWRKRLQPPGEFWRQHLGKIDFSFSVQSDVEYDQFTRAEDIPVVPQTLADQKNLLLPDGDVALFSIIPTFNVDGRDSPLNPTRGFFASFAVDFSKSLGFIEKTNVVQLLRGLMSISGYVPIYRERRIVLALSGRLGGIESAAGTQIIGTKRFFLGGTGSMRGFNEDGLVPEDVRKTVHDAIVRCHSLVSQATCGTNEAGKQVDPDVLALAQGTGVSTGGNFMALTRAELRFGLTSSLDGGIFMDAGNLWVDPTKVDLTDLRYAAGVGLRFPLPIGPAAFDVGFNLHPDTLLQEPLYRIHLSIGLF